MPTVSVNLSTTEYVQVNSGLNPLILQSHRDTVRIALNETQPARANTVFHTLGGDNAPLTFNSIDTNMWALAMSDESSLTVSELTSVNVKQGSGDLVTDAWGVAKSSIPQSLFHGLWTFDIPPLMWHIIMDGSKVAESVANGASSVNGALTLDTSGANVVTDIEIHSRRHPRYQPNRGHLYSTAVILPDTGNDGEVDFGLFNDENGVFFRVKADGLLYAVRRSNSVDVEYLIDTSNLAGFDLTLGNVYDIQYQWRGVGNYNFYINLTLVYALTLLGTLSALSIENPALPAGYKCTKGATQDVSLLAGCVDITSENGTVGREQYGSAVGTQSGNNTDHPVVSIYNPLTINGKINTRDLKLARITASSTARCTVKVWKSSDITALTGAAFVARGDGSFVEVDTAATALVPLNASQVTEFKVPANGSEFVDNPSRETIDFFLTHGDLIIVTYTGNAEVDAVIEWGEEI